MRTRTDFTDRPRGTPTIPWRAVAVAALLLGAGCHSGASTDAPAKAETAAPAEEGVVLKAEELEKAGIETTPVVETRHSPETVGYAVVMPHDAIAQALSELSVAEATEHQSRAALARVRELAGTPGAGSVEAQETAARQASVDHAALLLAERRLTSLYGSAAPWKADATDAELGRLANGTAQLVRATFPLDSLTSATPKSLRLAGLADAAGARSVESHRVWAAPADPAVPGRSVFAVVDRADFSDGERLTARVATGAGVDGFIVPASAVVLNAGKYWCYVEHAPGHFERVEVDDGEPVDGGYFVTGGVAGGDKVVTKAAGLLLAKEFGTAAAD